MKRSVFFRSLSAFVLPLLKTGHLSKPAVHVCVGRRFHKHSLPFALMVAALLVFTGSAKASSFTYTVDFSMGSDVVTGSIVTTCDNCALSAANISSYLFTDTDGNTVSSTGSIHTPLDFTADPLFATSTAITDTAPASGTDEFEFFGTSASTDSIEFYNYSAAYEQSHGGSGALLTGAFVGNASADISSTTIATIAPAATPEPSSLLLLGTGLFGTVGVFRKRFA